MYSSSEGSPGTATFGSTLSSPSSGSTLSSPSSGSNLSSPSTASLVSPVVEPEQEDSEDDDGIFDKDDDEDDAFFDAVGFDTPQKAEIVMDDSHVTPKVGEVK